MYNLFLLEQKYIHIYHLIMKKNKKIETRAHRIRYYLL